MRGTLFAALLLMMPTVVAANDWDALKQPGAIALMRHALAPGTGDPASFQLGDCSTQRNLNNQGREQARRTGKALRDREIVFDEIWSSGWCRARETAELLEIGPVAIKPALHSFFAGRGDRNRQTRDALDALAAMPGSFSALLVTHQVNITALTGAGVASGEIVVVQRQADGTLEVSGRVVIAP